MSKQVRLEDDVYARIAAEKREDETFSEAIDRLTSDWSLAEWAGWMSEEEAHRLRERLDEADDEDADETDELLERTGVDVG